MYRVNQLEINVAEIVALVQDNGSGAVVTFVGVVRDHSAGRTVTKLLYEAHESMAETQIGNICDVAKEKWGVQNIAVRHRTGMLQVGDVVAVIAVSAPHRREAFQACEFIIDRVKKEVPIWKKEFYADGGEWIGAEKKT